MKRQLSLVVLSAVVAGFAHAAPAPVMRTSPQATVEANTLVAEGGCKYDKDDLFEEGRRVSQFSQNQKGKCLDTTKFRPGKVLSETAKSIKVANFMHNGKFWTAEIPKGKGVIKQAYLHIVRFPVVEGIEAAHSQLRFKLADDFVIKLTSQSGPAQTLVTDSFVLTVEAAFPKGVAYSFADGAFDNYPLVGRLQSATQRIREDSKVETEQHILKLSDNADQNSVLIDKLATASVKRSESIGLNTFYNTVRPNCVTEVMDLIDNVRGVRWCDEKNPNDFQALIDGQCVRPFYTAMWIDPVAGPALKALKARKIYGGQAMNLKQEYSPFIGKPVPPVRDNMPGLVRNHKSKPFALVTLMPKNSSSAATTKLIEAELEKTLATAMPSLTSVGIAPALAAASSSGAIGGVVKYVQSQLTEMIKRVNHRLPTTPTYVVAYLVPWDPKAKPLSLAGSGFPADLPFNYERNASATDENVRRVINNAYKNMRELQNQEYKVKAINGKPVNPVFLLGVSIRLKLQRDRSESVLQTVMSMVPQDLPFSTAATVDLTRVRIPMPRKAAVDFVGEAAASKATMIVSHLQKHPYSLPNPEIRIDFGGMAPIPHDLYGAERDKEKFGLISVLRKPVIPAECGSNMNMVPEMQGTFFPDLMGKKTRAINWKDLGSIGTQLVDKALDGVEGGLDKQEISLGIYSLKLVMADEYCHYDIKGRSEAEKIKFCRAYGKNTTGVMVWDMQVGTRIGRACVVAPQVGEIVTAEANASLEVQLNGVKKKVEKSLMNVIMGSNNENAKLAMKLMMEANAKKAALEAAAQK